MKSSFYRFLFSVLASFLLLFVSSCVGTYQLQTGRSMGKGKAEFVFNLPSTAFVTNSYGTIYDVSNFGFSGRVGISERADIGFVYIGTLPHIYGRYQVLGDQYSTAALALGIGGGLNNRYSAYNYEALTGYLRFFAFFSLHRGDFAWYLSPQYVLRDGQRIYGFDFSGATLSTGVEYKAFRHLGLGFDWSVADVRNAPVALPYMSVTAGIKVYFGK